MDCTLCNKIFTSISAYDYHKNNLVCQKNKKIYKCLICEKEFDHKGNFEAHSQTKTCNSELIVTLKEKIHNLEIQNSQLLFDKSTLDKNLESLQNNNDSLTLNYNTIKTQYDEIKLSNSSLLESIENILLEKLTITEDLLFNNNKLTLKLFSLIRQIILNHHNNKYFDIIKKIIFKLKTFNNIHKDINEHFHIIFNNPDTQKDDLKTTFKYFKPLLKDQKYFDNYFKINFKIDSDNFDFSSV